MTTVIWEQATKDEKTYFCLTQAKKPTRNLSLISLNWGTMEQGQTQ
jgi:hypothetical protein